MLKTNSGKILNVSSVASKTPGPFQSVYHATKAFVQSFTEAIRSELKETHVTVTALLPGAIDTDFFNKADMQSAKVVVDGKLAPAAPVAKDGYDALMSGDEKVISVTMNKIQTTMTNFMTDAMAESAKKQNQPGDQ